jgi:16S rRNA (uracil1498-N3)-methyltransferase
MEINAPVDFEKFVQNSALERSGEEKLILFSERGGAGFSSIQSGKKITALVGSEGGWETSEIENAAASGFQIITLAGRILRAETAAIAVPAILQNVFGDLR